MEKQSYRIVTHFRPDDDEFVAIRIIELWGRDEFPGVSTSPLITVDAGLRLTVEQIQKWLAGGHVLVGTGGRLVVFEEHGKGDGSSAATYAAEHYGISENPALKPILAYSLAADDRAEDHPFAMASIIKALHSAGVPLEQVRAIHREWFDALYLKFGGRFIFTDNRPSFRQIAIAWLIGEYGKPEHRSLIFGSFGNALEKLDLPWDVVDHLREIARYVDTEVAEGPLSDFDLAGLVYAMQVTGATEKSVMHMVSTVLKAKVHAQKEFMAAQVFFKEKAAYLDSPLRIAVIRSDSAEMQRAARATDKRLSILIQQRSSGHVQIFSDHQRDLRPLVRRLREAESRKSGRRRPLSFTKLSAAGTLAEVPEWYAFEKYGQVIHIFNSSLKTRRVRKTRLTLDEVVACALEAAPHLHRARGVVRDRNAKKSPAAKSAALLELIAEDQELYEERQSQPIPSA